MVFQVRQALQAHQATEVNQVTLELRDQQGYRGLKDSLDLKAPEGRLDHLDQLGLLVG